MINDVSTVPTWAKASGGGEQRLWEARQNSQVILP